MEARLRIIKIVKIIPQMMEYVFNGHFYLKFYLVLYILGHYLNFLYIIIVVKTI